MSSICRGQTIVSFCIASHSPSLNENRYRPKDPATFLAGDIVEVQVSLAVFKTREGKKMLNPVLRGVTLLSDKFSKVCNVFGDWAVDRLYSS